MIKKEFAPTTVRITAPDKKILQEVAERRGLTMTELLVAGGLLLAELPDAFVQQIKRTADAYRLPMATVLVNFMVVFLSRESAMLEVFGTTRLAKDAFQHSDAGLLGGDRLSEKVFTESKAAAEDLLKRLKASAEKGEPIRISHDDAAVLSAAVQAAR